MSNLEHKSRQIAATNTRINALMNRLQERSGKPLETKTRLSRLVYLLLDTSGSMSGEKLSQAKSGAVAFAKDAFQKSYGIGLITFDEQAALLVEAKPGGSLISSNLQTLEAGGGTNIAAAIEIACTKLKDKLGEMVICIVSDGEADRDSTFHARDKARAIGIEIMTLGVDGADMDFLNELATRKDLSVYVPTSKLQIGMQSMAKLLPG
jgi:Ca-activated chloride channel family protein